MLQLAEEQEGLMLKTRNKQTPHVAPVQYTAYCMTPLQFDRPRIMCGNHGVYVIVTSG
jgi:hypothetical protein